MKLFANSINHVVTRLSIHYSMKVISDRIPKYEFMNKSLKLNQTYRTEFNFDSRNTKLKELIITLHKIVKFQMET